MQTTKRDETFRIDRIGMLVRSVVPRRGKPYDHRCNYPATIDVFLDAMTEYHALREKMTG